MPTAKAATERFYKAVQREDELWQKLGGKHQGDIGFSQRTWAEWLEAVAQTTAAATEMRRAYGREATTLL
jgi:hypothetical protein